MKSVMRAIVIGIYVYVLLFTQAALATVVGTSSQVSPGIWEYSYEITNDFSSTLDVWSFDLDLLFQVLILNITSPTGWFSTPDPSVLPVYTDFISWYTPPGFGLYYGDSLSGFTFQTNLPPAPDMATYTLTDDTTQTGSTVGPTPEPATLALFALGVAGIGRFVLKRRSQKG